MTPAKDRGDQIYLPVVFRYQQFASHGAPVNSRRDQRADSKFPPSRLDHDGIECDSNAPMNREFAFFFFFLAGHPILEPEFARGRKRCKKKKSTYTPTSGDAWSEGTFCFLFSEGSRKCWRSAVSRQLLVLAKVSVGDKVVEIMIDTSRYSP